METLNADGVLMATVLCNKSRYGCITIYFKNVLPQYYYQYTHYNVIELPTYCKSNLFALTIFNYKGIYLSPQ